MKAVLIFYNIAGRLPVGTGNFSALLVGRVVPPGSAIRLVAGPPQGLTAGSAGNVL
jgi:hypothetical protein